MAKLPDEITIGQLATRTGAAASALRFYEEQGLIASRRTAGNQRRYDRATVRRVSVIRAAKAVGLSLEEIAGALGALPRDRTPTKRDWEGMSRTWRDRLDRQIAAMERLRTNLTGCIGCGCLSLRSCALFNTDDEAAVTGTGARYLLDGE